MQLALVFWVFAPKTTDGRSEQQRTNRSPLLANCGRLFLIFNKHGNTSTRSTREGPGQSFGEVKRLMTSYLGTLLTLNAGRATKA